MGGGRGMEREGEGEREGCLMSTTVLTKRK